MQRFGAHGEFELYPLAGASFGGQLRFVNATSPTSIISAMESEPEILRQVLNAAAGLLLLKGLNEVSAEPSLMLRLSQLLGPSLDDYHENGTPDCMVHQGVPEIFVVSNAPSINRWPPPRPNPPLCPDGTLPVTFPHRRGWHTDQSFRRPPPDISVLYAVQVAIKGQGQTLFADCAAAFDALPTSVQAQIEGLIGIHAGFGANRSEDDVRNQRPLRPLLKHECPQLQPVVRVHPVTGRRALYLCDGGQMDWVDGPFVGMATGAGGDGARLLYELLAHLTKRQFVYVHEWDRGDLVIFDNRNLAHAVTWYDAENYQRTMWRTTVSGNPGKEYDGERPSWIPAADE
jgi:taurine dioxygenase